MRIALLAPFGAQTKGTVQARILPLARTLAHRGHMVRVVIPPWDDPTPPTKRLSTVEVIADSPTETAGVHIVTLAIPKRFPRTIALTLGLVKAAINPSSDAVGARHASPSLREQHLPGANAGRARHASPLQLEQHNAMRAL